jgi:hypothetical protein
MFRYAIHFNTPGASKLSISASTDLIIFDRHLLSIRAVFKLALIAMTLMRLCCLQNVYSTCACTKFAFLRDKTGPSFHVLFAADREGLPSTRVFESTTLVACVFFFVIGIDWVDVLEMGAGVIDSGALSGTTFSGTTLSPP